VKHTGLLQEVGRTVLGRVEIDEKIDALSSAVVGCEGWLSP
jgi:hypothetical protein